MPEQTDAFEKLYPARRITLSSESPNWCTPEEPLNPVYEFCGKWGLYLDPFGSAHGLVRAHNIWLFPQQDALALDWPVPNDGTPGDNIPRVSFVQPPYGRKLPRCAKQIGAQQRRGAEMLALLPNSTGTEWWREMGVDLWCAWHKRIAFLELEVELLARYKARAKKTGKPCPPPPYHNVTEQLVVTDNGATFDSAMVYFGPRKGLFTDIFSRYGDIWTRPF